MIFKSFSKIFKYFSYTLSIYIFSLIIVGAQSPVTPNTKMSLPDLKDVGGFLKDFNDNIVQNLVILLSGIAVVLFLYGLVRFIFHRSQGSEASKLKDDKKNMLWGLAAVFVLVTLWGIINMVQGILGVDKNNDIHIPKICVNDNCSTTSSLPGDAGNAIRGVSTCPDGTKPDSNNKCIPITSNKNDTIDIGKYNMLDILNWNLVMKEGDSGENVAQLQKFLKDKGFATTLNIDGKYGPATTQAVKAFQSASKLIPDGIIGPSTRAVIAYRYLNADDIYGDWPLLSLGSTGEEVGILQDILQRRRCYKETIDNDFGENTAVAVGNFQRANSLVIDKTVGPSTRAVLIANDTNNC